MRKRIVFTLLSLLLSLICSAAIAELTLRYYKINATWMEINSGSYGSPYRMKLSEPWVFDSGKNWKSSFKQSEFNIPFQTNAEGVRDISHPIENPANELRIVALGDSFTMGQGAALEDTWPKVLEGLLEDKYGKERVRVLLGGVAGSDPVFAYQLFKRRLMKYKPHIVLLQINDSDVNDINARGGTGRFTSSGHLKNNRGPSYEWLWEASYLFRLFMIEVMDCNSSLLVSNDEFERRNKEAVVLLKECIEDFVELAKKKEFQFMLINHPYSYHLEHSNPAIMTSSLLKDLDDEDVPSFDLYPTLEEIIEREGASRIEDYYWPLDAHFKPLGYELLAQGVFAEIEKIKLVQKSSWSSELVE